MSIGKYIYYHLKASFKKRSTYVVILSLALFILVIMGIKLPNSDNVTVGVIKNESQIADKCFDNMDSMYSFIEYENINSLENDIITGTIECGFIFSSNFDRDFSKGRLKNSIDYIYSPYTTKGLAIKESIFSSLLTLYSNNILLSSFDEIFIDFEDEKTKEKAKDELIEKNAYYLSSNDIFAVDFNTEFK